MDPISEHLQYHFSSKALTIDRHINQSFAPGWKLKPHPTQQSVVLLSDPNNIPVLVVRNGIFLGAGWDVINGCIERSISLWNSTKKRLGDL